MTSTRTRAFTLVEMLVVIAIIAMLMGLLLPAILGAVELVRQTKCEHQLKNHSLAIIGHAITKRRLPGYADTWRVSDGAGGFQSVDVGWFPQVFDYLDMRQRSRELREWTLVGGEPAYLEFVPLVTCPTDKPDFEQAMWSETTCGGPEPSPAPTVNYPSSYAVSAGRPDATTGPPDDRRYALFHDLRDGVSNVITTMDDITDGKSNTLMLTESIDLAGWSAVSETHQGVVWLDSPTIQLNRDTIVLVDCDEDGLADNLDHDHARPSSYHQQGFNIALSDGSTKFFFIDDTDPAAAYNIYKQMMTPAAQD